MTPVGGVRAYNSQAATRMINSLSEAKTRSNPSLKVRLLNGIIQGKAIFQGAELLQVREVVRDLITEFRQLDKVPDGIVGPNLAEIQELPAQALAKLPQAEAPAETTQPKAPPPLIKPPPFPAAAAFESIEGDNIVGGGAETKAPITLAVDQRVAGLSVRGGREENQDSLYIDNLNKRTVFVIADGIGGELGGEVASGSVVGTFAKRFVGTNGGFTLEAALHKAHEDVMVIKQEQPTLAKMGTTVLAALIEGDLMRVASVGDCRAFLVRDGEIRLITRDHKPAHDYILEQMGKDGLDLTSMEEVLMSADLTREYYERTRTNTIFPHAIFRAIGLGPKAPRKGDLSGGTLEALPAEMRDVNLAKGDLVIMASDGMHDYLAFRVLEQVLRENQGKTPAEIVAALRDAITEPGDNITIVVHKHEPLDAAEKAFDEAPTQERRIPFEEEKTQRWEAGRLTKLMTEATSSLQLSTEAQERLAGALTDKAELIEARDTLQGILENAAHIVVGKNRTIEELETQVATLERQHAELQRQAKGMGAAEFLGGIQGRVEELVSRHTEIKTRLAQIEADKPGVRNLVAHMERQMSELQNADLKQSIEGQVAELKAHVETMRSDDITLKQALTEVQRDTLELKTNAIDSTREVLDAQQTQVLRILPKDQPVEAPVVTTPAPAQEAAAAAAPRVDAAERARLEAAADKGDQAAAARLLELDREENA